MSDVSYQTTDVSCQIDVQRYLAYALKIMELSTKFSWAPILKYDRSFSVLLCWQIFIIF